MTSIPPKTAKNQSSWRKTVALFGQDDDPPQQVALFPEGHAPAQVGVEEFPVMRVRLAQMALRRPRQWGACRLGCHDQLAAHKAALFDHLTARWRGRDQ